MIISHSNRFIFLANRKTASTSIGIAFSSCCSQKDVIAPLGRDEKIRRELGYPCPRNYIPWQSLPAHIGLRLRRKLAGKPIERDLKKISYHTHITAAQVLEYLPRRHWDSCFRFCFVRNPWDRAISHYFWTTRSQPEPISLDQFIEGKQLRNAAEKSRAIYSLNGEIAVHRLCQFENAQSEVNRIFEELNLSGNPLLPETKRQFRSDRRHYREVLNDNQAARIATIFDREIALAGYTY
ncbi:sulfotransferase family 2 domain-containing protein [Synechococcus sp. CS-1328]|uniref:sulfotransferase family 2 domain-containing protein n=1 Tax=Synechococcus sp. CS-1328 TaxID=2847976 RepID=UPI0021E1E033|nr:sulfotransferase family 2 domain-containing protein [Synechococcus sp. CS-1328]MCT0223902.1 sulfotransferase family 2 domain-containing protein [Synechococcus sp. CS-1328]